jgi:hypothetical protein
MYMLLDKDSSKEDWIDFQFPGRPANIKKFTVRQASDYSSYSLDTACRLYDTFIMFYDTMPLQG